MQDLHPNVIFGDRWPRPAQVFNAPALRAAREAAGLSQEQAASAVSRSWLTLLQWESGRHVPPANVLSQLAGAYGISVGELWDDAPGADEGDAA